MNEEKTTLTIRIPKKLREAAADKAKREDVTVSQVLRQFLRRWTAKKNDQ